ncbi:HAMP domain-containing sensor histidine kinase [Roseivirga sp.]|uniref:sensor histidine kinase n=1 Tax=Roseivirga sp. TaxID=1964215 RepID=UPI002B2730B4|nr:HAMP domain-containing sensor histidine kinase [Roseivirga sp.]
MEFDYPSILFFLALNNLFIIVLFIYQYFYHHKQWYLLLVVLGIAFQTITIILFGNRDILPELLTSRINNFLLISSFALTSFGLLSFDGKLRKNLLWVFTVSVLLFYFSILVVEENNTTINVVRIVSTAFFYGIGAFYLFSHQHKYRFSILISGVLSIYSVFQLFRAFKIYQMGEAYNFTKVSTIDNWFFAVSVFVISASSIGFIMLLKEVDQKTILSKNKIIQEDKLKLQELNLTQNKLFSIIAHDLRGPFSNILILSKLLSDSANNTDSSESKKYIGLINSTAENTLNLLENLLNWSKSQTRELNVNPEKVVLSKVIREIIALKTSLATTKNISLHYSPANEIELYTDENILRTVLRNLISNAIKFTNIGGRINVFATTNHNQVEISVADNGVGMSEERIHEIFELSTNTTSRGTANEAGSGLGLVLCKEFVDKLDGQLWVESEQGKGSNFKFKFPINISTAHIAGVPSM